MEWYEYIISSGITTILIGLVAKYFLENHKKELNKELSVFETRLKNSIFYFSRQFEALSALYELFYGLLPTKTHPEMEWEDACSEIALDFEQLEKDLNYYLAKHTAVLETDVIDLIREADHLCAEGKFEIGQGGTVTPRGLNMAEELYKKLSTATNMLRAHVDVQRKSPE
ncbi:MAG: hypothetical protein JRF53_10200 [Deltaproteobacteria bacterium]|nr:hypothetical protein [Deltaproteobacteria bacterium]